MRIKVDPDVERVAEFMDQNFPVERMVGIAAGLYALAHLVWARYEQRPVQALSLVDGPGLPDAPHARSTAT